MSDFATLGETMVLFTTPEIGRLRDMTGLRLSVAGAESNVAIGICRLGYSAAWTGRVGADEFGHMILGVLRREGVDVAGAVTDASAQTALMVKERRTADIVRVSYYRHGHAGSRLCPSDLDEERLGDARVLHVTGVTLGLSASARAAAYRAVEIARAAGALVSFDLNYRSALWSRPEAAVELRKMVKLADLVFATEDELAILDPSSDAMAIARDISGTGGREVVVKRGVDGAVVVAAGAVHQEPAFPVQAVDPVGAGDAFVAGYLAAALEGASPEARLRQGCATGAFAVTVLGDWEGLPGRDDLELLQHAPGSVLR